MAFLEQLLNPATQNRLRNADRPAGIDVTIAVVEDQRRSTALELGGKRTTLPAHQTPLHGGYSRLNWCPGRLDNYTLERSCKRDHYNG